jgi:hypothetical protein
MQLDQCCQKLGLIPDPIAGSATLPTTPLDTNNSAHLHSFPALFPWSPEIWPFQNQFLRHLPRLSF